MKKFFPVLFALFVIGQNCAAQALHSGSALRHQTQTVTIQHAQQRVADATPNYWADAVAYYDDEGRYLHEGVKSTYTVQITLDGTDVAFDGLVPGNEWNRYDTTQPVHGVYDPEAKTVTIPTRPFDYEDSDNYSFLGTMTYFGSPSQVILLAGNFLDEADEWGQHALSQLDELVFDVNDDLTLFTSRTGYGAYVYQVSQWGVSGCGFLNFMKSGQIGLIREDAELVALADTILIEGINVVPGAELTRTFSLANKGTNSTTVSVSCDRNNVFLDYDTMFEGLSKQTVTLTFLPQEAGQFDTDITFTAKNGSSVTVHLRALVNEAPDFSAIVRGGNLTFANDGDTPFVITSDVTGFPVALSTNAKTDGLSILNVYATVPAGQTGVLLWKGLSHVAYSMGTIINVDGYDLVNNVYTYMQTWEEIDLANAVVLSEGRHIITFEYANYASWRAEYAPFDMQMYVYDLELRTTPTSANAAVLKTELLDMGRHYVDCLAMTDCQYVELINAGTDPLRVTAISQEGAFGGIVDGVEAAYGEPLLVPITFTAEAAGQYSGQVTISTTAGDFVLSCQASAEQIPVDYHPIVLGGNISFNTSMEHPFSIDGNRAFSSTAYESTMSGSVDSWIEIIFEVPAGKEYDLEWQAKNSSQDFMIFMDNVIFTDGTIFEVDGVEVGRYAGEDINLSSDTFDSQYTHFGEGLHTLRFTYHKVDSQPAGEDRFSIWNVRLIGGEEISLNIVGQEAQQQFTYNLQGQRTDARQQGFSIVQQRNADGSSQSLKVLNK